jgi:DNA-directed RNA polymerase specialized sigma24 family protein
LEWQAARMEDQLGGSGRNMDVSNREEVLPVGDGSLVPSAQDGQASSVEDRGADGVLLPSLREVPRGEFADEGDIAEAMESLVATEEAAGLSDLMMIERIQRGDERAFEQLRAKYRKAIEFTVRINAQWESGSVEAAAAYGLWRAAMEYDSARGTKPITYLLNYIRWEVSRAHRVRKSTIPTVSLDENPLLCSSELPTIDAEITTERTLAALPDRHAQIVRMRMEGDTIQEIGAAIGVSGSRVFQLLAQAQRSASHLCFN